jgi:hypothetical protein
MRKIRLDIDTLAVESFSPTGEAADAAGTVRAHAAAFVSPNIPTLDTGYHGCYACPATVIRTCVPCA